MLSTKLAGSTIFNVFGLTRKGIKTENSALEVDALPMFPIDQQNIKFTVDTTYSKSCPQTKCLIIFYFTELACINTYVNNLCYLHNLTD